MPSACTKLAQGQGFGHGSAGSRAVFSACCPGRGGPSASLFPSLLPAVCPSITHIGCLSGTFMSSVNPAARQKMIPLTFARQVSEVGPWKSLTNRGAHVGELVAGSGEVAGSLYFCTRPAKTNSFSLIAALCEGRRRGGIPIRDCKNNSLCVCLHEMFAFEHLRLAQN